MDALRKKIEVWLNKPKADDQSLLARFYYADKSLSAIASELDSFDGRTEPDRCSRLVGKLRQEQDRVLCIINQIMDDLLLPTDRACRNFRVKFPEEVLQESLAGQLWFGAECLAAGSSIMHRESESNLMRPLAKAVTKSLDNVRNQLREQCLRNNTPNASTIKLNSEDASTEKLYESLKIFDRLFAEFEFLYVSAMVQVKSKEEYEAQELVCVLFSETLQRALKNRMLTQDQVDSCDPALMFSIPRLSIVAGLIWFDTGPLDVSQPVDEMSDMFKPFRKLLLRMRELLRALSREDIVQLEKLLCTNEMSRSTESVTDLALDQQYVHAEEFLFTSNNNEDGGATGSNLNHNHLMESEFEDDDQQSFDDNEKLAEKVGEMSMERSAGSSSSMVLSTSSTCSHINNIPYPSSKAYSKDGDNLLHRLFVCIAGVADQLQTNFASDLRHILKNVFLINCSQNESLSMQQPNDMQPFIFHATEDNVLASEFSTPDSIQTAEEVIEDTDNNGNLFSQLADVDGDTSGDRPPMVDDEGGASTFIDRSFNNEIPSTAELSPTPSENGFLRPPQWIPDSDAPRCMSCAVQFTPFRRRHHCRNCGGVFCNICSNSSKPLPKYGFHKAVRVCNECISKECED